MCLTIQRDTTPLIAEEDIKVYKFVIPVKRRKTMFLTSYQHFPVKLGCTYKSELRKVFSCRYPHYTIEEGLHSFVHLESAVKKAKMFNETVVECIIPKGSSYYVGTYDGFYRYESIASDTLKYVRVINP